MSIGVVLVGIIFFGLVVNNLIKDNKPYDDIPKKQNQQSNRIVFNERESKPFTNRDIKEFEDMMEKSFYRNINYTIKQIPSNSVDNPQAISLAIEVAIGSTYKSLKEKLLNDPQVNSVLSNQQVINSLNKVRDRVLLKHF
ncbi:hypothetical protein CW731_03200 [Polaribacter sp. ALD11]|uniref:hypothetical protein n=1 Tax=Polaribacter sp. ALD11 TaxID=2058137 RepID=UPI000C30C0C5|nr:hypothetical protein [Polaribacter sp. ALD11]AUC84363.1 hypothetical protein CW731_03200 [Polaribacter sp. ALD11]